MTCKIDSTRYAYVVDNDGDTKITHDTKRISIAEYLDNEELQEDIKNNKKLLICKHGHILRKYKSNIVRSHFFHEFGHTYSDDIHKHRESEWHMEWKSHFKDTEVTLKNGRRADAIVGTRTLEFQHSHILRDDVKSRSNDHKNCGYNITWIIDCNDNSISVDRLINDVFFIKFKNGEYPCKPENTTWKYESFRDVDYIFLDHDGDIYRINPQYVINCMVYTKNMASKDNFIKSLIDNTNIWNDEDLPQCNIYMRQMGAGCGKTYDSLQLLNADPRFKEKNTFIYLSKMKTAIFNIYREFLDQCKNSDNDGIIGLYNIEKPHKKVIKNKYIIEYINKLTNKECKIVMGTIDAFMWAVGHDLYDGNGSNMFIGIVNSIHKCETGLNKNITFGIDNVRFCKETMIIIDESQDLDCEYIEAIGKIMVATHLDTYIIGDKLQSIWNENNMFTYLESREYPPPIHIERTKGKNIVRRFQNKQFINFVNNIIDFEKFNLEPIEGICGKKTCTIDHDNKEKPWEIFDLPNIDYRRDHTNEDIFKNEDETNRAVDHITGYLDEEISKHHYLPKHFLFIFPFLKKNEFANRLESKLEEYWVKKFNQDGYFTDVVMKDEFWKEEYNRTKYIQYVYLHKSDEGQSINLEESKNATRILSIHASKGMTCTVVFLLGISEETLHFFTNKTDGLQYTSLLHVALTRQELKLYIGLDTKRMDNIVDKFRMSDPVFEKYINNNMNPDYSEICKEFKPKIDFCKIKDCGFEKRFDDINERFGIVDQLKYVNMDKSDSERNIIDWGHHVIRSAMFRYFFMINIYNKEKYDDKYDQFKTIVNKMSKKGVEEYEYSKYYRRLNKIRKSKENMGIVEINKIPLLYFTTHKNNKYYEYKDVIKKIIKNIQEKIKTSMSEHKPKLPEMCPLECIVFWHILEVCESGTYTGITIMDVYNILYCYDMCYVVDESHDQFKCICNKLFSNKTKNTQCYPDIKKSIQTHYDKIIKTNKIYDNYKKYMSSLNEVFKYNINHMLRLCDVCCDKNLSIFNKYWLIAYSKSYVVNIIFKPVISEINFSEIYTKMIYDNYVISSCYGGEENKNCDKFHGKKIINCLLSLNLSNDEPIFFDIYDKFLRENTYIDQVIKNDIVDYFSEKIIIVYKYLSENKRILNEIRGNLRKSYDRCGVLKFMVTFVGNILENIQHNKKNVKKYNSMFSNIELFTDEFKKCIEKYVDELQFDLKDNEISFDVSDMSDSDKVGSGDINVVLDIQDFKALSREICSNVNEKKKNLKDNHKVFSKKVAKHENNTETLKQSIAKPSVRILKTNKDDMNYCHLERNIIPKRKLF